MAIEIRNLLFNDGDVLQLYKRLPEGRYNYVSCESHGYHVPLVIHSLRLKMAY